MTSPSELAEYINAGIAQLPYPKEPANLYAQISYTLESGGKRLRPTLLLAVVEALGGKKEDAINQAIGLEMFHNFTLLHDDVMDNADVRRGRPTVHRKWGRDAAILSGDTMLTMSTQLMCDCPREHLAEVLYLFNRTAIEIYEGQQYDMNFEERNDVTVAEYMEMIRLKTSVLLGCACKTGAILANASPLVQQAFYDYGIKLGLAFQLQDDYLDTYGDPLIFGKQIGGDIVNAKKTWLLITAQAEDETAELKNALTGPLPDGEKIDAVRNVYNRLGLDKRIASLVEEYALEAVAQIEAIDINVAWKEYFRSLAMNLVKRSN